MQLRVNLQFENVSEEDWQQMRDLAEALTDDAASIRVFASDEPNWLAAEFSMATEPQYKAVPKIERALKFNAYNSIDVTFGFIPSAAEAASQKRRNARAKARRKARRKAAE